MRLAEQRVATAQRLKDAGAAPARSPDEHAVRDNKTEEPTIERTRMMNFLATVMRCGIEARRAAAKELASPQSRSVLSCCERRRYGNAHCSGLVIGLDEIRSCTVRWRHVRRRDHFGPTYLVILELMVRNIW